jgi:erythromycin esterase
MKTYLLFFLLTVFFIKDGLGQLIKEKVYLEQTFSSSNSSYNQLSPYLKGKNLFIVGEANHGSHEIFKVKESFIKYLAKDLELKDVVIEANFATCLKINEYVTWKTEANPEDLAKLIYVWPYRTKEFVDLISWMREFNKGKKEKKQINIWGMDMQQAYPALKILQYELAKSAGHEVISIPTFENKMEEMKYNVDDSIFTRLSQLVNTASTDKQLILKRCLEIVRMHKNYLALYKGDRNSLEPYRDSCMAANVAWIYASLKADSKVFVWAHNSHIQKKNQSSMRKISMGSYLNNSFGKQAYFIGFDFNKGTYVFPHPREKPLTVAADELHYFARLLDGEKYDLCFIPFTAANQAVLNNASGMRYNMGLVKGKHTDLYDAIFFIDEVTPVKMLD